MVSISIRIVSLNGVKKLRRASDASFLYIKYKDFSYIYWHDIKSYSGHCKKLAPEYSAAAEILAKNDPPFYVAKVDATENKKLGERFGVQGFPTLFFFK